MNIQRAICLAMATLSANAFADTLEDADWVLVASYKDGNTQRSDYYDAKSMVRTKGRVAFWWMESSNPLEYLHWVVDCGSNRAGIDGVAFAGQGSQTNVPVKWTTFGEGSPAMTMQRFVCAQTQAGVSRLRMNQVYQGRIKLPDFAGRDRNYASFKTRISKEMRTGPNFAGHYAIIEVGCGTGCSFVFMGDVATGEMFSFPYGGEEYSMMSLDYRVKDASVGVKWQSGEKCYSDYLNWNGVEFISTDNGLKAETDCG